MIGNRKQGNPNSETEKANICPKQEDFFPSTTPTPSPLANGTHLHSLAQVHAGQHLQEAQEGF